jgi:Fe-S-cluster containining protein
VQPDWPACRRWEHALDCQACGACCREAYHSISVERRGPTAARHPELVVDRGEYLEMQRVPTPGGSRCVALHGGDGGDGGEDDGGRPYHCVIYTDRPRNCREFENAGEHCLTARRRVGLSR